MHNEDNGIDTPQKGWAVVAILQHGKPVAHTSYDTNDSVEKRRQKPLPIQKARPAARTTLQAEAEAKIEPVNQQVSGGLAWDPPC